MTKQTSDAAAKPQGMVFPCDIDIKVFGRANVTLENSVQALLKQYLAPEQIISIRARQSSKGNYQSLSCKVQVNSKQHGDQIFIALNASADVVMVL